MGCVRSSQRSSKNQISQNQLDIIHKKVREQYDWGTDIIIRQIHDIIYVDLVPPDKFKHLDYQKVYRCHIYLYELKLGYSQPIQHITAYKFSGDTFTLQFRISKNIKIQVYKYVFAFQLKNQTNDLIKVKRGKIIIDKYNDRQISFKRNNSIIQKQLQKKIDQIKQNGYMLNILLLGKVDFSKSSFIRNYMIMLKQLYGFQYYRLPLKANERKQIHHGHFQTYSLTHEHQKTKIKCQINLINSPDLEFINFQEFTEIYYNALKLFLNGELDYDRFFLPQSYNLQKAKQHINLNKIIHYCLIIIEPSQLKEAFNIIQRITSLISQSYINYGLIINRSDKQEDLLTMQLTKRLNQQNYKMHHSHIFTTCLNLVSFPQNQICYNQFETSIYYSLATVCQQIQNTMLAIYLQQNNKQQFIQIIQVKKQKTLQQFIKETRIFQNRNAQNIQIKYKAQDTYLNIGSIINQTDPIVNQQQKNVLYYISKANNRWKIVFRFKNQMK